MHQQDRRAQAVRRVIEAPGRWPRLNLSELLASAELIWIFALRETKLRYRQTVLGAAWIVLTPVLGAVIFSFVFSTVAHLPSDGVPYFIFAFVGTGGWTAFSSALGRMSQTLVTNGQLVTRVYFERLALCAGVLTATLVDVGVIAAMTAVAFALYGFLPPLAVLTVPLWLLILLADAAGLGLIAGSYLVRYRDVSPLLGLLTQLLLYLSPVAYGTGAVPARLRIVYEVNPLVGAFDGLRWATLGTPAPSATALLIAILAAALLLAIGLAVFRNQERTFADVI